MSFEAGQGEHHVYRILPKNPADQLPLTKDQHYLGVDAVAWFLNKKANWFNDMMASGTFDIVLASGLEKYQVALGAFELKRGASLDAAPAEARYLTVFLFESKQAYFTEATMRRFNVLVLTLFTFLVSAAWPQAQGEDKFTTFDVPAAGTGPGQGTIVNGINAGGAITGWYLDASNVNHGFLRLSDGTIITFDAPGAGTGPGQGTIALGMNSVRAITGQFLDSSRAIHGFLRSRDGTITTFDAPGAGTGSREGTVAANINPAGEISGEYRDASHVHHGFVRAPDGTITTFDAPGAGTGPGQGTFTATFYGLNPAGALTTGYLDSSHVLHGIVRAPDGTTTTFDANGAGTGARQGTFPDSINPEGAITGWYVDASNANHGFLRLPDGTITTFDAPGAGTGAGQGTVGANVNPAGAIAGFYIDANNVAHGFLRLSDGTITTFDAPGAGTGAGQGTFSIGNNPSGAITGYYVDGSNVNHGFLRN